MATNFHLNDHGHLTVRGLLLTTSSCIGAAIPERTTYLCVPKQTTPVPVG